MCAAVSTVIAFNAKPLTDVTTVSTREEARAANERHQSVNTALATAARVLVEGLLALTIRNAGEAKRNAAGTHISEAVKETMLPAAFGVYDNLLH